MIMTLPRYIALLLVNEGLDKALLRKITLNSGFEKTAQRHRIHFFRNQFYFTKPVVMEVVID
jgi:hypothetical protein